MRISPALRSIIEKARAVDPAERYRSAKELASDIRHYLFDEEVSARPDTPLQKFMRFLHRHRYAALLIGVLAFGIARFFGQWVYPHFPRRVVLVSLDLWALFGIVIAISILASIAGVVKAMRTNAGEVLS